MSWSQRYSAILLSFALLSTPALSQSSTNQGQQTVHIPPKASTAKRPQNAFEDIAIKKLPSNLLEDQKRIWTAPVHLRANALKWAIPLTFGTAFAFGIDHAVERKLPTSATTIQRAGNASNLGAAVFAGVAVSQYLWGLHTDNDKLRETGFLSGEAALDSFALAELVKGVAQRQRPTDGTGDGKFFSSPTPLGSSFPSQHAAAAWAMATVIANEYPGPATKLVAYGGATAIGAARIIADKHYASDVLIGSALGYFVGREVYAAHSSESKMDEIYGSFDKSREPVRRDPTMMGSPYVPLDSWVYPAFNRLYALGYLPTVFSAQRPWTRKQCAEMLNDVDELQGSDLQTDSVKALIAALQSEFKPEIDLLDGNQANVGATLESVYTRFMGIGGTPLNDSMHFGQTIFNDYGRPYAHGLNQVTGISGHAESGPFVAYLRAEYQHAPGSPAYSLSTRNAISVQDGLPVAPGTANPQIDRMRLLDAYVGVNVSNWQLTFGKQSMWWGPARTTDLMWSNNAEPVTMLRLSNTGEKRLPWLLGHLGPFSSTTFVGQLQGYHFLRLGRTFQLTGSWDSYINPQPFVWGEHFSVRPTENLEIGASISTVFAGLGRPMTLSTFKHTFSNNGNAQPVEPGDRRTGFDFSYKVPGLRNWLTIYSGSLAEDEPNPLGYPRRSAWNPGIYLSKIPKFNKLDLRVESGYTDVPNFIGSGVFYTNLHYAGGYTYNGNIIASWIGPEARALNFQSSYWFDAQKKLTFSYRMQRLNSSWSGGGSLKDIATEYAFRVGRQLSITTAAQYEKWDFPALATDRHDNVMVFAQFSWHPGKRLRSR